MKERIVTNVHKENGVIEMLYGHGWKPRRKEIALEEIQAGHCRYFCGQSLGPNYPISPGSAHGDTRNPIRPVRGAHGDYLRTDPNPSRTNLGALEEPGRLEGYVKDEQSRPVKDADIVLFEPSGEEEECDWPKTRTDAHGHFVLDGVPEGAWKLVATVAESVRVERPLQVRPRQNEPIRLQAVMTDRDHMAALAAYGRKTGVCAVCGRRLSNPASVARGIGPVCATRL